MLSETAVLLLDGRLYKALKQMQLQLLPSTSLSPTFLLGYELTSSMIADIKGRPLKAYKRGTVHGMVCTFCPDSQEQDPDG